MARVPHSFLRPTPRLSIPREASDRGRQVMAAGGRIAMPVGDLTDEEIDLIKRSEHAKKAPGGEPEA